MNQEVRGLVRAEFRLNSPAFLGGAFGTDHSESDNPLAAAELRLSSILGLLRLWWRAHHWPTYCPAGRLEAGALLQAEESLFGASASESEAEAPQIGQGALLPRIATLQCRTRAYGGSPYRELAPARGQRTRLAIEPGAKLALEFLSRPTPPERSHQSADRKRNTREELESALRLLGLFGGLGYGWRRGLGSVQWSGGNIGQAPLTFDQYHSSLQESLNGLASRVPPAEYGIPLLSAETRFYLKRFPENTTADTILGDLSSAIASILHPQSGKMVIVNFFSDQVGNQRRPSPFLCHIHALSDATVLVVSHLRSQPENATLTGRFQSLFATLGMVRVRSTADRGDE